MPYNLQDSKYNININSTADKEKTFAYNGFYRVFRLLYKSIYSSNVFNCKFCGDILLCFISIKPEHVPFP